ncbi:hypothetical protein [Caldichromatium japonicum]|uniref:hypothetical protein n=1 Tax=Caldichromatium japonicum TaxID=2699430 RepID=UPI0031B5662D
MGNPLNDMPQPSSPPVPRLLPWLIDLPVAAILWVLLYRQLTAIADLGIALLGLSRTTRLGEAVHFFTL